MNRMWWFNVHKFKICQIWTMFTTGGHLLHMRRPDWTCPLRCFFRILHTLRGQFLMLYKFHYSCAGTRDNFLETLVTCRVTWKHLFPLPSSKFAFSLYNIFQPKIDPDLISSLKLEWKSHRWLWCKSALLCLWPSLVAWREREVLVF